MKVGTAFAAGAAGGAAMVAMLWIARAIFGMDVNLSMMLGTMVVLPPGPIAWVAGFVMHLIISGLIALAYAWGFEHVTHRAGWATGVAFSVIHAFIGGLMFGLVPAIHWLIPEQMPAPGMFLANKGALYVLAFFVLHAVYGAIVGAIYAPAERRVARTATV
jgi:hypothetical protein